MTTKVYVFLADGFEEIEAITPIDVLRRAEYNVVTVSITDSKIVKGVHNIPITADAIINEVDFSDADVIFLPGGLPGAHNLNDCEKLRELLLTHNKAGKIVSAICAAPLILGGLGILEGKNATCYPGFESQLTGANTTAARCEVDGNIITANGPGGALALSLAVLKETGNAETANQLEVGMMFK